jgi:DNA-binding transcriptional LysR family regulator
VDASGAAHMQNFDLNLLRALDALLTEKNVTRAADKVFVTQSTMSGMLGRLRDQFSDRLLIRSGRRYDLSPLAQSLAISVRQTLLQIEATISAKPLFDPKTDRRSFKIMASDYATITYLSEVFRRIARSAPLLGFEVVPIDSPLDSVRNGNVDLCITGNPEIKINNHPDQLLRHDILFSEVYCCVVDQHHPLNGRLSIDSYFKFPLVLAQFSGVTMATRLMGLESSASKPNTVITVPTFSVIPSLVIGTQSIGVIPKRMVNALPTNTMRVLALPFEGPSFTEQLIWHSRFAYDPAFCWLRSLMLDVAEEQRES